MDEEDYNDDEPSEQDEGEESFADLLASYEAGMKDDIRVGDKIRGRIIAITASAVFVGTGTKNDGIVEREELVDEDGNLPYSVGDELELYVVAAGESEIRLSRAITGIGGVEMLKEAHANAIPIEGMVKQTIKGGFHVEVMKRRAFCPISQIDTVFVDKPEGYVGKTFAFLIKKLTEGGRNIVVSRRDLLEAEQKKARDAFMQTLSPNQVLPGRITRLMPYGVFVELVPGVEGMVHISELSWSRLDTPEQAFKAGEQVQVVVLRIEPGQKQKKIALSIKQALGDPWQTIESKIHVGQKLNGRVTRCAKFGAFVELEPGIEGLVHISEMSFIKRVIKPEDLVQAGQTISVLVKEIDTNKRRIGLSMRDAQGDPWLLVETKYTPGKAVDGTVENRESFGLFVALEPGVVGLLPKSEIGRSPDAGKIDKLKAGDPIAVSVDVVNLNERKISLKLRNTADESNWQKFAEGDTGSSLGSLGDKLAQALKDKKD